MKDNFRGAVAVVGIGSTPYYKRGESPDPERLLCLKAISAACDDAGIDASEIDGFCSYGAELNEGAELAVPLGIRELRWSTLIWGGGGGGSSGAIAAAAAAIVSGQAETVVVYRASAESTSGRLLEAVSEDHFSREFLACGVTAPAQLVGLRAQRQIEFDGIAPEAARALVQASYYHARNNEGAVGRHVIVDDETYAQARAIVEPFHLYDCSRENDAAAAIILTCAERARDLKNKPAYLLSAAFGCGTRFSDRKAVSDPNVIHSFRSVANRVWKQSGYQPRDVDVAQIYLNFSISGAAVLVDHGFCSAEESKEKLTFDSLIAPNGWLPVNTSGGDLAEGFMHGMGNALEAVRQIRGTSVNQVPDANLSLLTGGPMGDLIHSELTSSALFGSEETL